MVLRLLLFSSLFALASCAGEGKKTDDLPTETPGQKGESLFINNCAACHGEDGKLGASGAKDLSISKLNEKQMKEIISNGKNAMPPQKAILETDENIQLVIEHVKRLRK